MSPNEEQGRQAKRKRLRLLYKEYGRLVRENYDHPTPDQVNQEKRLLREMTRLAEELKVQVL